MQTTEQKKAIGALQRAETILEKNYQWTGEVKLLPLIIEYLHDAVHHTWKAQQKKRKPRLIKELETLIQKKKHSPIEFQRKQQWILCSENYKTTQIDEKKTRNYLEQTKAYLKRNNYARR